jgi:hypothetical protein
MASGVGPQARKTSPDGANTPAMAVLKNKTVRLNEAIFFLIPSFDFLLIFIIIINQSLINNI